jgi:hypothetical protein
VSYVSEEMEANYFYAETVGDTMLYIERCSLVASTLLPIRKVHDSIPTSETGYHDFRIFVVLLRQIYV